VPIQLLPNLNLFSMFKHLIILLVIHIYKLGGYMTKYKVVKQVGSIWVTAFRGNYDACSWWIGTQRSGMHRIELDI
jgi:hypothetical protein|tara:strand:- start:257 stop:484 length:228 start_codon:yes stop_codon:yes gene_type:complete